MYMNQVPFNPEPDGTSRTIKANYWKVSRANFIRGGGYGATAVAVYRSREDMEQERKHNLNLPPELQGKKFRIRKLTPRECFRLMGVDDADIDKIQASGISNSSQYKLAGNSIVVDVLFHLFRKMFIETGPDMEKGNQQQLTLF